MDSGLFHTEYYTVNYHLIVPAMTFVHRCIQGLNNCHQRIELNCPTSKIEHPIIFVMNAGQAGRKKEKSDPLGIE